MPFSWYPPTPPPALCITFTGVRIKQGDLTDPDYFDFISFAQYATVAMAIRNGRDFFEEKVGAEGEKITVQRDPDFKDNARLPEEHARRVGDKILVSEGMRVEPRPLTPSRLSPLTFDHFLTSIRESHLYRAYLGFSVRDYG